MDKQPKMRWPMYVGSVLIMALAVFLLLSVETRQHGSPSVAAPRDRQGSATPASALPTREGTTPPVASHTPSGTIDSAYYRKTSDFDPGTLWVYLRNPVNEPMVVKQVLLDGLPITTWGVELSSENVKFDGIMANPQTEHPAEKSASAVLRVANERVYWARLTPSPVPPGGISDLSAKLANAIARPVKVEFVMSDGQKHAAVIRPIAPALTITAITFSEDFGSTYVYVENGSERPLQLASVEVNGAPVTCDAWFGSKTLSPGSKDVIILKTSRTPGTYMTVRLLSADGAVAEERVRVLAGFPIGTENGITPVGLGLDKAPYLMKPEYLLKEVDSSLKPDVPPVPSLRANYIFTCPMHCYGRDYARSAREIFRRHELSCRFDPNHPTIVNLCRTQPETGYALFAETADILCINPNIPDLQLPPGIKESPSEYVAKLSRLACLAARPRPFVSVADLLSIDGKAAATVSDFRSRTYAMLAAGAKGILYRNAQTSDPYGSPVNVEAVRLNNMLRSIRSLMSIADVVDWATLDAKDGLAARALLAGDKVLLVFLIDDNVGVKVPAVAQGTEADAAVNAEDAVRIKIAVPRWVRLTRAERLDDGGQPPPDVVTVSSEAYELRTPRPQNGASLFLLPIVKENP